MKRLITPIAVAIVLIFASGLDAQSVSKREQRNGNKAQREVEKNRKAQQDAIKRQQKNAAKNAEEEERDAAREEREAEREARKNGEEEGPSIVGGAEGEDIPEPGEATDKKFKEDVLEGILDELGVTDEGKRKDFHKYVTDAWEDSEKEDKRWAGVYRRYEEDAEKLGEEKKEHAEKLKKIWDDSDEDLTKKEVLTEEQMKRWKEASEELRTKTNTDRYYEAKPKSEPDVKEKKEESED